MPDRRSVRWGELFTSDELDNRVVDLEEVPPNPKPPREDVQVEPWGLGDDAPAAKHRLHHGRLRHYLREYGGDRGD
jgi:hypothetical protein